MPPKKAKEADDVLPAEVTRIDQLGLDFDPDPFMARGDARDAMLNVIRATADWSKFDEQRQRDINAAVDQAAETIVAKLVRAIAAEGRDTVQCKLESMTIKDGIKLQLSSVFSHDNLVLLGDLQGKAVTLTMADTSAHDHQRGPAPVVPDQPDLLSSDTDDLALAGDEDPTAQIVRTGDHLDEGMARVDLKTGMVQASTGDDQWTDVREATPDELAAERDRTADFDDADTGDKVTDVHLRDPALQPAA
jgi:hypothetical protein